MRSDSSTDVAQNSRSSRSLPSIEGDLTPVIAASWERSLKHGLRRADRALFNYSVSETAAKRIAEANRNLLQHVNPELQALHSSLKSPRWLTLCVNQTGEIVCFAGDRQGAPNKLKVLMQTGRLLLETELGTTAPGCTLEEGRPTVVSSGEHFLTELREFFCACAPIFGVDGRLAGALDITGIDVAMPALASEMVMIATRRIENNIVCHLPDCALLRFHCDERLIGTLFEGIVAVDSEGKLRGMNRTAWQLLAPRNPEVLGAPIETLFEADLYNILRQASELRDQPLRIKDRSGALNFMRAESREDKVSRGKAARQPPAARVPEEPLFFADDGGLKQTYDQAVRIARSGLPLVIRGETGTGKELFARSLHRHLRPNGPFMAINCAAIPEGLIESELFGYAEGAFTGGRKQGAAGKIMQAHNGVLLLDEIGDMPLALQSRFLRVLQERTVTRIGEATDVPVDIIVVGATHQDLQSLVEAGRFRADLYYRLSGFTVELPPVRSRGDRSALIAHLLHRWNPQSTGSHAKPISNEALQLLTEYPWPGNVRQLELVIRGMFALRASGEALDVPDVPAAIRHSRHDRTVTEQQKASDTSLVEAELKVMRNVLREQRGNISAAARALGISRGTLYSRLRKFGIET